MLGRTQLQVSALSFGAWAIGGGGRIWAYGPTDDATSRRAIAAAVDAGCTFFDTADCYGAGRSERLLGEILGGRPEDVAIATKVGIDFYAGPPRPRFHPAYLRFAAHESLRRLRRERLDLLQLHNPPPEVMRDPAVAEVLEDLKRQGKVRALGISAATVEEAFAALDCPWVETLQAPYNLLLPEAEDELFPRAAQRGLGILAREPLANGILSGKHRLDSPFPEGDIRRLWPRPVLEHMLRAVHGLRRFCRPGESMVELALRFALARPEVTTVLCGCKTPAQVQECFSVRAVKRGRGRVSSSITDLRENSP